MRCSFQKRFEEPQLVVGRRSALSDASAAEGQGPASSSSRQASSEGRPSGSASEAGAAGHLEVLRKGASSEHALRRESLGGMDMTRKRGRRK